VRPLERLLGRQPGQLRHQPHKRTPLMSAINESLLRHVADQPADRLACLYDVAPETRAVPDVGL
jgi:hypothetical protein